MGQDSGCSLACERRLGSGSPTGCSQGVCEGYSHLQEGLGVGPLPRSHDCWQASVPGELLGWGLQFLAGCWPEAALTSLLAACLLRAEDSMAACFIKVSTWVEGVWSWWRDRENNVETWMGPIHRFRRTNNFPVLLGLTWVGFMSLAAKYPHPPQWLPIFSKV